MSMSTPMANYAAARRVGDFVFMSGIVAVDPQRRRVVTGFDDLPESAHDDLRPLGYVTGQISVDVFEAPIVAQSWVVLDRIRELAVEHGGTMADVCKLVQYFRHLHHYAPYLKTEDKTATPAEAIARLVRRKLDFTFDHPQVSRLFSYEVMSGGAAIRRIWAVSEDSVNAAVRIIGEWVRKREIEPIEPIFLLFHIWALTQHYADYEPQVRFFIDCPPEEALDRERICAQIICFVLRGVGLGSTACADRIPVLSQRSRATPPADAA